MESSSEEWHGNDENKPGRPFQVDEPSFDTIKIKWNPPSQITTKLPFRYDLRYQKVTTGLSSRWTMYRQLLSDTCLKLENLPSESKFIFKVRIVDYDDVEGPFSEQSDEIETIKSAAIQLLPLEDVVNKKSNIPKKCITFEEDLKSRNTLARTRKLEFTYDMSAKRLKWIEENRPRECNSQSFRDYKTAKSTFRRSHKIIFHNYIESLEREIETAAEIDNNSFWRLINQRKKRRNNDITFEMIFDGLSCKSGSEINEGWKCYFEKLFTPTNDTNFCEDYKRNCEEELSHISHIKLNLESLVFDKINIDETNISPP